MGLFIYYSLHFVERYSIKVQCNRLIPKPGGNIGDSKTAINHDVIPRFKHDIAVIQTFL